MCLGNKSKGFTVEKWKDTGLHRYVSDFSVGYDDFNFSGITNIHKYLTEKHSNVYMFGFIKQTFTILVMVRLSFGGSKAIIKAVTGAV